MWHGDVLGERARISPGRIALVDVATGSRFTYAELDSRASRAARALTGPLGLRKGDRLGLLAGNRPEFLDVFFAAGKSGIVVVPLGTKLTAREVAEIARHSGMRRIAFDAENAATARAVQAAARLEDGVALESLARAEAGAFVRAACGPEDLYALLYTSGTTGRPKGVRIPHRMVAFNAYDTAVCWQLRESDVTPVFTPLYHAGGLGAFLLPVLAAGGAVVLHAAFDANEVWRTIEAEGCTVVLGVPTIFRLLMEAPGFRAASLSRLRWMISGGAPLPRDVLEAYQARGIVLKQGYGLTEAGVNCFTMTEEESVAKAGSIGRPLMYTEARLLDDAGREVADGAVGELALRGPHVSQGYWEDGEATAAAFGADGFLRTGDLARRDADGFYFIAGRRKDMLISGGVNVYPAEIENELFAHPSVADVAVVGVPDPRWGEAGVAFVVPRAAADPLALRAYLEERLARFKVPREFVFVDALPRTAYGKVVKAELRDRYLAGTR
jgi:fatty-acyl-CoA synthase